MTDNIIMHYKPYYKSDDIIAEISATSPHITLYDLLMNSRALCLAAPLEVWLSNDQRDPGGCYKVTGMHYDEARGSIILHIAED